MTDYDGATALVVVDMQNDFADPAGSLYVKGGEDVVPVVNNEIGRAGSSDSLVVYTQDWHPPDTPHFAKDGGIWPVHCVRDTWGAELHPELQVIGEVVKKGTEGEDGYSGFTVKDPETGDRSATRLGRILADRRIKKVVVVGLAADYCVKATALDALDRGFATHVPLEATRAVDIEHGDGAKALDEIRSAGGIVE